MRPLCLRGQHGEIAKSQIIQGMAEHNNKFVFCSKINGKLLRGFGQDNNVI